MIPSLALNAALSFAFGLCITWIVWKLFDYRRQLAAAHSKHLLTSISEDPKNFSANWPRYDVERVQALERGLRMALVSLKAVDTHESITGHLKRVLVPAAQPWAGVVLFPEKAVVELATAYGALAAVDGSVTFRSSQLRDLLAAAFVQPAHYNMLSPAEVERLAILMEEYSEVIHIGCKTLRHGFESKNPLAEHRGTNREQLQREIGDASAATSRMLRAEDISTEAIDAAAQFKLKYGNKYLHHQESV